MTDLLVLGSGIAGLSAAIHASRRGMSVVLLTKGEMAHSATHFAQGGVAAVLDSADSTDLHLADTMAAGAGLCDESAVRVLVDDGPDRVRELMELGAQFDYENGRLAMAREGGHSLPRVVHAGGDATGAEIERALRTDVRDLRAVEVREGWFTIDLLIENGRCVGVTALDGSGGMHKVRAKHTLLATGGAGQLYSATTNPSVSTGDGVAMAFRAGAAVADVEFMQFHPTALASPSMPRPLLSEALRGEGAVLRDSAGVAFMSQEHPLGDLAPRDVVARAITTRMLEREESNMWLDCTSINDFETRFPTIWRSAQSVGLDPERDLLPVAPAAHYLSGGVCTDLDGAATIPGLWACGEVACSGVHGANRLASNSLLDGLVFAPRVVEAIGDGRDGPERTGVLRDGWPEGSLSMSQHSNVAATVSPLPLREALQDLMTSNVGVLRDGVRLEEAALALDVIHAKAENCDSQAVPTWELRNLLMVATALVRAALLREETRGTHSRLDYPCARPEFLGRYMFAGSNEMFLPLPVEVRA
ncbi:MAG: L-aspartate oxidase [Acidimicrobiia bacterium]|nr:L-aspartate oxidase [Acidimicrobiia bacterium]